MNASSRPPQIAVLCCFCAGVLPIVDGRVEAFRTPAGQFYCSEFCADDAASRHSAAATSIGGHPRQCSRRRSSDRQRAHVPEKWTPVFRQGHAQTKESEAHPDRSDRDAREARPGRAPLRRYFNVLSIFAQACATAALLEELLPGIAAQPPFSMNTI
jgi:hypothetical protein